jgi:hypothetical protein
MSWQNIDDGMMWTRLRVMHESPVLSVGCVDMEMCRGWMFEKSWMISEFDYVSISNKFCRSGETFPPSSRRVSD